MSSRKSAEEKHKELVASWDRLEKEVEKRERGGMAGVSENITPVKQAAPVVLTQDVDPLSTQEMIDLVNGKAPEFRPSKQSVKKARVTPHPPVPPYSSSLFILELKDLKHFTWSAVQVPVRVSFLQAGPS